MLAFCGYQVSTQFAANEARHADLRDSFIHLWAKHESAAAQKLYVELIGGLAKQSNNSLIADQKRAALFASTRNASYDDLLWRYYCSVNKELEKRHKDVVALNNKGGK